MRQSTGEGRRAWFWVGVTLLSLTALFWLILVFAVLAESGIAVIAVAVGLVLSIVPVSLGYYCIVRGRKSGAIAKNRGRETISLEQVNAAMETMKDAEGQSVKHATAPLSVSGLTPTRYKAAQTLIRFQPVTQNGKT